MLPDPTKEDSLGLRDEIEAAVRQIGRQCHWSEMMAVIDEPEALLEALADPRMTSAAISRVLMARGFQIKDNQVRRHRSGKCSACR